MFDMTLTNSQAFEAAENYIKSADDQKLGETDYREAHPPEVLAEVFQVIARELLDELVKKPARVIVSLRWQDKVEKIYSEIEAE